MVISCFLYPAAEWDSFSLSWESLFLFDTCWNDIAVYPLHLRSQIAEVLRDHTATFALSFFQISAESILEV